MPAMSSAYAATDAARRLTDALANPALAAPFARFGAQTMDAIQKLADIFSATGAQPPNPTPPPRHTCATGQLPRLHHNTDTQEFPRVPPTVTLSLTDHQAPPRVPPTVPPCRPLKLPPGPPPRVEPSLITKGVRDQSAQVFEIMVEGNVPTCNLHYSGIVHMRVVTIFSPALCLL